MSAGILPLLAIALAGLDRLARATVVQEKLARVRERMAQGEWRAALAEVLSVLRLDPDNAKARFDSDGDGLPDPWEWALINASGGLLPSLADVRPEDDFDHDRREVLERLGRAPAALAAYRKAYESPSYRDRALARGAPVYLEVVGYGLTNDAFGYLLARVDWRSFERYDYITRVFGESGTFQSGPDFRTGEWLLSLPETPPVCADVGNAPPCPTTNGSGGR